ncbi:MAG: chemotaxis protein CheA [Myxococcales bacterium]|nr:chemotaxis protein CheA [Myxococcales bacterium]
MDPSSSEFIGEAQESVETFSRHLLELEAQSRSGNVDPDRLNATFRAVHSLKGLAGLFNAVEIGTLAHAVEGTLDRLRLGRIDLSKEVLDVLFEAVELFGALLIPRGDEDDIPDLIGLLEKIEGLSRSGGGEGAEDANLEWLGEAILSVLSEYEEHRLRENLRKGRSLYRVHASFDILAIDVGIEQLKEKMKAYGEVITYLPSADITAEDRIDLDIILGTSLSFGDVSNALTEVDVTVHRLSPPSAGERAPSRPAPNAPPPPPPLPEPTPAPLTAPSSRPAPERPPERAATLVSTPSQVIDGRSSGIVDPAEAEVSLRSLSQTVRVDLRRLDILMNLVGELGLIQANLTDLQERLRAGDVAADAGRQLQSQVRDMARKLALLQQGILDVRMVPIGQIFDKLHRVVRKLSRELSKEIRLMISGADTVLDKLIVEELSDPLMHMIRNCIDHGIEAANERAQAGKPPAGRIDLRAFQKGNRVVIEVEDDGRGMDWRRLRELGIRRGLITMDEAEGMSPTEAINLIFAPGFSTREEANSVSGRGVGMDVVKTNIAKLSGMIDVHTEIGRGSRFSITLPVTLAIIQALVIESAGHTFCIPLNAVLESIMAERGEVGTIEGQEVITVRGKTLPLLRLSRLFGLRAPPGYRPDSNRIYVVVVGLAQHRVGLVVDELLGQQDVVIKPLGKAIRNVPGIAGATELGANRTVLLLDVARLVDEGVRELAGFGVGGGGHGR